jgi:hypothetical protein
MSGQLKGGQLMKRLAGLIPVEHKIPRCARHDTLGWKGRTQGPSLRSARHAWLERKNTRSLAALGMTGRWWRVEGKNAYL